MQLSISQKPYSCATINILWTKRKIKSFACSPATCPGIENGQMFGRERLGKQLSLLSVKAAPAEVVEAVLHEIHRHAGTAEQFDDITMLALTYRGDACTDNYLA